VDLALEWYPPVLLALAHSEEARTSFCEALERFREVEGLEVILLQNRWAPGPPSWELLSGQEPTLGEAMEDGLKYRVSFMNRQNTGLFLANREARRWIRKNSRNKRVLNLFAFTGAFGVCAVEGGAVDGVQIDMKSSPLMEGRVNLSLNQLPLVGVHFWAHDILRSGGKIRRSGPYDLVILDPPTYQKGAWALERDMPKLIRHLDEWTTPDAKVLFCAHDPFTSRDTMKAWMKEGPSRWTCCEELPLPEGFEEADPDSGVKVLVFEKEDSGRSSPDTDSQ